MHLEFFLSRGMFGIWWSWRQPLRCALLLTNYFHVAIPVEVFSNNLLCKFWHFAIRMLVKLIYFYNFYKKVISYSNILLLIVTSTTLVFGDLLIANRDGVSKWWLSDKLLKLSVLFDSIIAPWHSCSSNHRHCLHLCHSLDQTSAWLHLLDIMYQPRLSMELKIVVNYVDCWIIICVFTAFSYLRFTVYILSQGLKNGFVSQLALYWYLLWSEHKHSRLWVKSRSYKAKDLAVKAKAKDLTCNAKAKDIFSAYQSEI